MTSFTVQSQVDADRILSVLLPGEFQGQAVTVVVKLNQKDPIEVLRRTAGTIPDLERPPQADVRWMQEQSEIQSKENTVSTGRDWDRAMLYDRFDREEAE